jgi:hypothetical protein
MDAETLQIRKQLEIRLITRALQDPAFHQRLLTDPRGAFEEEMGIPFPAALTLQFVQEAPTAVVIQLPALPAPGGELSDNQLDAVAAGTWWTGFKRFVGGGKFEVSDTPSGGVAGVRG